MGRGLLWTVAAQNICAQSDKVTELCGFAAYLRTNSKPEDY